jgi:hypothetical protein
MFYYIRNIRKSREVLLKVIPLYISSIKRNKYRYYLGGKETEHGL